MPVVSAGALAPAFQLAGIDGKNHSLKEGLEKGPVVAAFFKVTCPTCQFTFPFLERLYRQLGSRGGQIWGIVQDNAKDGQRFAKQYGVTFPILVDDRPYTISRQYRLQIVPTIFLIGSDGSISASSEGFCKADLLAIQRSLAQSLSVSPGALFQPSERIPEYKPG